MLLAKLGPTTSGSTSKSQPTPRVKLRPASPCGRATRLGLPLGCVLGRTTDANMMVSCYSSDIDAEE